MMGWDFPPPLHLLFARVSSLANSAVDGGEPLGEPLRPSSPLPLLLPPYELAYLLDAPSSLGDFFLPFISAISLPLVPFFAFGFRIGHSVPDLLSLPNPCRCSPLCQSFLAPSGFIVTCHGCFLAFQPFSPSNLPSRHGFRFGFLVSLFFLLEFVFVCFCFCFCCFFCLFRYTLWMMILGFHSNFSMCSTTHRPLLDLFSHSHHDELSTPFSDFDFGERVINSSFRLLSSAWCASMLFISL
jgi:hypothetical protein